MKAQSAACRILIAAVALVEFADATHLRLHTNSDLGGAGRSRKQKSSGFFRASHGAYAVRDCAT